MTINAQAMPDRFITDVEASQITGMSRGWFQRARWSGDGPPFVKLGAAVRYRENELRDWFAARTRRSTSDTNNGVRRQGFGRI